MTFKCKRCGYCCKNIVIPISYSDIARWFNTGRNDILHEVSFINNYPRKGTGGFYITKTATAPKQQCPFLTKQNKCRIYPVRPRACKDFPFGHTAVGGCPAWDGKASEIVKEQQFKDFKMAHDNWKPLLTILVQARNKHVGN